MELICEKGGGLVGLGAWWGYPSSKQAPPKNLSPLISVVPRWSCMVRWNEALEDSQKDGRGPPENHSCKICQCNVPDVSSARVEGLSWGSASRIWLSSGAVSIALKKETAVG